MSVLRKNVLGMSLPALGFGTMRLPLKSDGSVDGETVDRMVDAAMAAGVNYFDTAYPYHGGMSERVIGRSLSRYPRESYLLADKYPGHQIAESYDPAAIFEEQLQKCGTGYFDFYLLHNVCENSMETYLDERWGIIPYFLEQRRLGRIRHLGFSTHARPENLKRFLEKWGKEMEFCQIQLNYLDYTLQKAGQKLEILAGYDMPVWVMEPVRGGKLAHVDPETARRMEELRPGESPAAWAFRWLQDIGSVGMILSGMSDLRQMEENIATFSVSAPLGREEKELLAETAERMKDAVPCTGCRYCCDGCPMGLDIPMLIAACNDLRTGSSLVVGMQMEALPVGQLPHACIGCGQCASMCPQQIDVPSVMEEFARRLDATPKWTDICREREEANRRNSGK